VCSISLFATPTVSNVTVVQDPLTHGVTVNYDLNEDAIVTVAFLTNDVVCEATSRVNGDVWRLVKVTGELKNNSTTEYMSYPHRKIAWNMAADLGAENAANYSVKARVSAWTTDAPPTYYVLDLVSANTVTRRRYYEYEGQLPGGMASDVYRTTKMVFRRIPAAGASFTMGSPTAEWNLSKFESLRSMGWETQHTVSFTKDFYLGVFEVTKAQYRLINGSLPDQSYTGTDADLCPVSNVTTWNHVRCNEGDCGSWPSDGRYPQNTHFLGKLRKFAGGTEVAYPNHTNLRAVTGNGYDLPTEAQWEFACRAGETMPLNNGWWVTSDEGGGTGSEANETTVLKVKGLERIARYGGNSGVQYSDKKLVVPAADSSTDLGTAVVGSYAPNAFGLYDMHGNVCEWCLDCAGGWLGVAPAVDPVGCSLAQSFAKCTHVMRGGSFEQGGRFCRSGARRLQATGGQPCFGFRLCLTLE